MNDAEKFAYAKHGLKYCPECGQALEPHPLDVSTVSCYMHGDFQLLWIEGQLQLRWKPMRMHPEYIHKIRDISEFHELFRRLGLSKDKLQEAKVNIEKLADITRMYIQQHITFLEAAQLITELEHGHFPEEPNQKQRERARKVLDFYTNKSSTLENDGQ